tara:strand:- start:377 stop:778 length:402 start_codon:yes stop_codon:yes gene_type:complete
MNNGGGEWAMKVVPHYEVKLYMGNKTQRALNKTFFSDEPFSQEDVEKFISESQDDYGFIIPVRITPTTFISGANYKEDGWEIAAINYPKIKTAERDIMAFMIKLAELLLSHFNQHTICVMDGETITMLQGLKY